jgi:hypothetical protein
MSQSCQVSMQLCHFYVADNSHCTQATFKNYVNPRICRKIGPNGKCGTDSGEKAPFLTPRVKKVRNLGYFNNLQIEPLSSLSAAKVSTQLFLFMRRYHSHNYLIALRSHTWLYLWGGGGWRGLGRILGCVLLTHFHFLLILTHFFNFILPLTVG